VRKTSSKYPLAGPNLAYGISKKVTKRTISDGMNRIHQQPWEFILDKRVTFRSYWH
jgi:hypothetical protein